MERGPRLCAHSSIVTSNGQFRDHLAAPEGARLEFKEARNGYGLDDLVRYTVALANEGGGKIILGVTDQRPRIVVGTSALPDPGQTEARIYERISQRVSIEEYSYEGTRVLIIHVPGRLPGSAWNDRGTYWMRAGEALVPMRDEQLQQIPAETIPDFSAELCPGLTVADLDPAAIAEFRRRWARREGNGRIDTWADESTLRNAELLQADQLTYAALLLFGTQSALTKHLPQAEVVFEYHLKEAAGPAQDRTEYREGFLTYNDRLWERVNRRNDRQSYQDGLFRAEVPTFDEATIREALLNAVCHREYRLGGSVFVRQFPRRLEVTSPGGFPAGVTPENVLDQQNPRNRRLAEALGRCGLIERSGQGMNLMFERAVRQSKPLPDFAGTGQYQVRLTLNGVVTNPAFLRFFERIGEQRVASFDTRDMLVLDRLQREDAIPEDLRPRLARFVEEGIVESIGRGRGTRYLLSRRFYVAMGQHGAYTRRRGLDREQNKALLVQHLKNCAAAGSQMSGLHQVLPMLSRAHLKRLLDELRDEGSVRLDGNRRWARWFAAAQSAAAAKGPGGTTTEP
jgi:ATP-dependent DNA helicase RecG